jgi:uncharacterized protein DUF2795
VANPIQVQKFLSDVDYPANKDELTRRASERGADENVMRTLTALPERRYDSPNDVSEEIGKQR